MTELDRLLAQVRRSDPVPAGTVDRVAQRLSQPPAPSRLWLPLTALAVAAFLWLRPTAPAESPIAARAEETAPRFQALRYEAPNPIAPPPAAPVRGSELAGEPAPTRRSPADRGPVPRLSPPALPPPALELAAPTPALAGPPAPQERLAAPAPAPSAGASRPRLANYRPRAIREWTEPNWTGLEREELPIAIQAIIARRDPTALLAALDALPLATPNLLLARGQLRAAADRCPEAVADLDSALARGSDPTDALSARAACTP